MYVKFVIQRDYEIMKKPSKVQSCHMTHISGEWYFDNAKVLQVQDPSKADNTSTNDWCC